jgi:hypothetical protein
MRNAADDNVICNNFDDVFRTDSMKFDRSVMLMGSRPSLSPVWTPMVKVVAS